MLCPICQSPIHNPTWFTCEKASCGNKYRREFTGINTEILDIQNKTDYANRKIRTLQKQIKELRENIIALKLRHQIIMRNRPDHMERGLKTPEDVSNLAQLIANGTKTEHICEVLGMTKHKLNNILAPRCRRKPCENY